MKRYALWKVLPRLAKACQGAYPSLSIPALVIGNTMATDYECCNWNTDLYYPLMFHSNSVLSLPVWRHYAGLNKEHQLCYRLPIIPTLLPIPKATCTSLKNWLCQSVSLSVVINWSLKQMAFVYETRMKGWHAKKYANIRYNKGRNRV